MYEFLATECTTKILAGHRITSPLLFGIRGEGNGFGNNADELRDSFSLFQNTVINPFQRTLLDGLDPLFAVNGIDLDFYFKTLKPADFIDVDAVKAQTVDEQEKEGIEGAPMQVVPGADGIQPESWTRKSPRVQPKPKHPTTERRLPPPWTSLSRSRRACSPHVRLSWFLQFDEGRPRTLRGSGVPVRHRKR